MSARLCFKRVSDVTFELLAVFLNQAEAQARAELLSGGAAPRAKPSWGSIGPSPARGFEYQRGDAIWVVEVDD